MSPRRPCCLLLLGVLAGACGPAVAEVRTASTLDEIRSRALAAKPGDVVRIAPGIYAGRLHLVDVRGAQGRPVVLEAADPQEPPVFEAGANGLQLTDAVHLVLRNLVFTGQTGNGLNVDDGGTPETPSHHVTLENLTVRDVGPDGNRDGIKLSGILDVRVVGCTVERWGRGGSAVDMVGCQRAVIEGNTFRHTPEAQGSGVQAKGGSRDILIRRNRFEHAGSRAVNAGGSTGLAYFRPPLARWKEPRYEAQDVRVEGNTFFGGQTPIAFVGVDGAVFRFNTVYAPDRWALRILQETREEGFVPARNGVVSDNVIVFRAASWSEGGVNVGAGTEPRTFTFGRNHWFCEDQPARTKDLVRLPTPEKDGSYGKDPRLRDAAQRDLRLAPGSPAAKAGADALPR